MLGLAEEGSTGASTFVNVGVDNIVLHWSNDFPLLYDEVLKVLRRLFILITKLTLNKRYLACQIALHRHVFLIGMALMRLYLVKYIQ